MTLRRISLIFLWTAAVLSLAGILILAFHININIPLTPMITIASFTFATLHAIQKEGWRNAILFLVVVFIIGLGFESIGVATGLVYGPYHYTDQLGSKFLDLVPYLIPVAWMFMMYPSFIIAESVVPSSWIGVRRGLFVASVSGLAMTAWDVVMDPMMVFGGNWVWEVHGPYFGVPIQNFFGWWLTTFVTVSIYLLLKKTVIRKMSPFPNTGAVYLYGITALTSVIVASLSGLAGAGLAGFFATVPWFVWGLVQSIKK